MGFLDGTPNPNGGQTLNSYMGKVDFANTGNQPNHNMNGFDDLMSHVGGFFGGIGQANQGLSHALTSGLGQAGDVFGLAQSADPYSIVDQMPSGGSADNSASASAPPMQGADNAGASSFHWPAGDLATADPQPTQQPLSEAMINSFQHMLNTPAIDPALIQQAFTGMQNLKMPDYLKIAQDAYGKQLGGINQGINDIHGRYDQVGTDMHDMYNTNANVSRLGNNNILQQVAAKEGNAVQDNARGNVAALAQLKNAELAQRTAVAQRGGMGLAQSDMKTDPADVAVAGTLQNAQQQANNAQAAATQNTNLNNEMANAIGTQGIAANSQLQNQRTSYDESMNKYKGDLANQEATREMEAQKQMHADQMGLIQARYGMAKDSAQANTDRFAALVGNKGFMSGLTDVGAYNLDQGKALQAQAASGAANVDPAATALHAYPQLATAYNNALAKTLQLTPGTKPTADDLYRAMANDPSIQGVQGNDLVNFAQMATANKAMNDPNTDYMLAMQNAG